MNRMCRAHAEEQGLLSRLLTVATSHVVAALCFVAFSNSAAAQQVADTLFHFANASPVFKRGSGPRICLDVAHNTFASARRNPGAFQPLRTLLEDDGFRTREFSTPFAAAALETCELLIVADAEAEMNLHSSAPPHASAFTLEEIAVLDAWVRHGGGLLLIADHTPTPGSAEALGQRLGVIVLDGIAHLPGAADAEVFARNRGEVLDHPVVRGRNTNERVDSVVTFTGHAFLASSEWRPLLRFSAGSIGLLPFPDLPRADWPHFDIDGWLQAATRPLGNGRVVWLAEVSVCTALGRDTGMNHPRAKQNAQFCLNIHRWLAGILND